MTDLVEIRWHARAGQGAKTAAHLLAMAFLRDGSYAQAFPEYGPERRGAPLRAFTRASSLPIRRHDAVTTPNLVCVLEPSLLDEVDVAEGLADDGRVLVADETFPARDVNLAMLGAAARALGAPPLGELEAAAVELLGRKVGPAAIHAALEEGFAWAS
ncbi:MAG TPA: 2-oxoacid:acceptor oxidoreductase family protein [Gaiellaceae bacterium]|nr:2-oxoacid:acceptor oxidoreductase family protein [Gaiellaceae bacterium]